MGQGDKVDKEGEGKGTECSPGRRVPLLAEILGSLGCSYEYQTLLTSHPGWYVSRTFFSRLTVT